MPEKTIYRLDSRSFADRDGRRDWFVNGGAGRQYWLPSIWCHGCGTWATCYTFPSECPPEIRNDLDTLPRTLPERLPQATYAHYLTKWRKLLKDRGITAELQPGNKFPPCTWDVPCHPVGDFFWPSPLTHIVTDAVVDLFRSHGFSGVDFFPATLERVGALPWDAPIPDALEEPDDWTERVPYLDDLSGFRFFEMVVGTVVEGLREEDEDDKWERCPVCGHVRFSEDEEKTRREKLENMKVLPSHFMGDADVFYVKGFGYRPFIKVPVREALFNLDTWNCEIEEFSVR